MIKAMFDSAARPFARGINDCFTAADDAVQARFGVSPMAAYRGRYKSLTGYLRILRKDGFSGIADAFEFLMKQHGFGTVTGDYQDGDVALVAYKDGTKNIVAPAMLQDGLWCIRAHDGLLALTLQPKEAWRYGD